jgi:hypothetical protein
VRLRELAEARRRFGKDSSRTPGPLRGPTWNAVPISGMERMVSFFSVTMMAMLNERKRP